MNFKCDKGISATQRWIAVLFELMVLISHWVLIQGQITSKGLDNPDLQISILVLFVFWIIYFLNYRWQFVLCSEGLIVKYLWRTDYIRWERIREIEEFGGYILITYDKMNVFDWLGGILSLRFKPVIRVAQVSHKNYVIFVKNLLIR